MSDEGTMLPSMRFDGEVAFVTGAGRSIGAGCARAAARRNSVYSATEHLVEGFTESAAVELAPTGVVVGAVDPTAIDTFAIDTFAIDTFAIDTFTIDTSLTHERLR